MEESEHKTLCVSGSANVLLSTFTNAIYRPEDNNYPADTLNNYVII